MIHIIFGLLAMVFGIWALSKNWWAFLDFACVFGSIALVLLGSIMLLAGIGGAKKEVPDD